MHIWYIWVKNLGSIAVVFGWQHLDLDLKSIDLKFIDFKIPCLCLFKQWRIWNFIVWIPKFRSGFGFRFKINKIYFLIIIFLIFLHFNFKIHEVILIVQLTRWWLNIFSHSQLKKLSCQLLTTKMFYIN